MTKRDIGDLTEILVARVAEDREQLVQLCAALVAARSVNPPGDTRDVADVVKTALGDRGLVATLHHIDDRMPSVIATVDSGRPGPHLVLNVHLDTMPPGREEDWTVPIWSMTRTGGRLYGLGMGNMKGAVAAMVHAAGLLNEFREEWIGRLTFTAVSDEVVFGDNGAAFLLRTIPDLISDGLICGEGPGFRRLAVGEKGVLWLRVAATGQAGHSSAVQNGRSASARLAAAICMIDDLNGHRGTLPTDLGELRVEPMSDWDDLGFELTANVGTVVAGTFVGQIAVNGAAEVDLRLPPGISAEAAQQLVLTALAPIDGLTVSRIKGWDPNWTSPESRLVGCWDDATAQISGHRSPYAIRLPASDASRWRRSGVPAICFGPQPTYSAGVDDYAEEDDVLRCAVLYAATALRFLQPPAQS